MALLAYNYLEKALLFRCLDALLPQMLAGFHTNLPCDQSGRIVTSRPEIGKIQGVKYSFRNLEDEFSGALHNPSTYINNLSAQGLWIAGNRYHFLADIFLECLVEIEAQDHAVIKGSIGPEPVKGKLLTAEFLKGPESQFAFSSLMIASNEAPGIKQRVKTGVLQLFIYGITLSYIGIEHLAGPGQGQEYLAVFAQWPGEYGPAKLSPALPPVAKLNIFPYLTAMNISRAKISLPSLVGDFGDELSDILIELAPADVSHSQFLEESEELLVHESCVHMDQYGYILTVSGTDTFNRPADHLLGAFAVIAVLLPGAKLRIDQYPIPGKLQGIEALALLIGGFYSLLLFSLVVVHNHGIQVQLDQVRLGYRESPDEYGQQDMSEALDQGPGKGLEKSLYCMGGDQASRIGLYCPSIGLILFQMVEIGQMPTCAIYEKSKELHKDIVNRRSFFVLAQVPKEWKQEQIKDPNVVQVINKEAESSSAGDLFVSSFHVMDFTFDFRLLFAILAHNALHFLGVTFWQRLAVYKVFYIRKLAKCGGLF